MKKLHFTEQKNIIRRIYVIALCIIIMLIGMTGCGNKNAMSTASAKADENRYSIVCTTYPQYDWTLQILGDKADKYNITLLQNNGVDLHSYQPTVDDIATISGADLFIYVGGESDKWVDDVLKTAENPDMIVIDMMESIGDAKVAEELKEGMQGEEEEDEEDEEDGHDESEEGHHHDDRDIEYDEHIWLSLRNASTLTGAISESICKIDPDNADAYRANAEAYKTKLFELDKKYEEAVSTASNKTLIFADRFPFRYMLMDYGLDYYAAFIGCSAESEASFETITFLSGKLDELGLGTIFVIETSDQKLANTVKENTTSKNQEIVVMNSIQSVNEKDIADGRDYYSIMEENLEALKKGLD